MHEVPDEIPTLTYSMEEAQITAIGSSSYAVRQPLGPIKGFADLDLLGGPLAPVGANSRAVASIAEVPPGGGPKFLGAAKISILNVAPRQNSVLVRIFIDWPNELPTSIDIIVIND
ncbi:MULTISPECIES: hypothetical protein [Streptomyces]|uniref:hypothetical protein n=1 Tax=Streptomyces TaxID=1883 RepID=UPI001676F9AD|nr:MULTISPECIES: hypothetical protein [Streptomyces]MBK3520634.1 hypothetical protein [Streptomyces sp. MBT70]GGR58910.1 hypothetical protein GCM10010236_09340 [Streptomyces eurythermus]